MNKFGQWLWQYYFPIFSATFLMFIFFGGASLYFDIKRGADDIPHQNPVIGWLAVSFAVALVMPFGLKFLHLIIDVFFNFIEKVFKIHD